MCRADKVPKVTAFRTSSACSEHGKGQFHSLESEAGIYEGEGG